MRPFAFPIVHAGLRKRSSMQVNLRRHPIAVASLAALLAGALPFAAAAGTSVEARAAKQAATGDTTDRLIVKYRSGAATVLDAGKLGPAQVSAGKRGVQLKPLRITSQGSHVMRLDHAMSV